MVQLVMTDAVREKLHRKHRVTPPEIMEAFLNREKGFLEDTREEHKSDPPTQWFVAKTDKNRVLKVVFIQASPKIIEIKTAYDANATEIKIYEHHAKTL